MLNYIPRRLGHFIAQQRNYWGLLNHRERFVWVWGGVWMHVCLHRVTYRYDRVCMCVHVCICMLHLRAFFSQQNPFSGQWSVDQNRCCIVTFPIVSNSLPTEGVVLCEVTYWLSRKDQIRIHRIHTRANSTSPFHFTLPPNTRSGYTQDSRIALHPSTQGSVLS